MRGSGSGFALALALIAGAVQPGPAESQDVEVRSYAVAHDDEVVRGRGFAVVADRRVFAVSAFMNAAGYDDEVEGVDMHPVRVRVRELVAENLAAAPEKVEEWKAFYEEAGLPSFVYMDYALSLNGDHPFERIRPAEEVGYAQVLETMDSMLPLLNDFWVEAELASVWDGVKPDYREELARYDFEAMEGQMTELWSYLRVPRRDSYTIVNVPNLLGQHYQGIGAEYENFYYTMETPGASSYALNTHEYLHSIVNPIVAQAFAAEAEKLNRYYEAGREGRFAQSYQHAPTFAWESLVRALDYRFRLRAAERANDPVDDILARVDEITEGGLTLVRPFFDALADYEAGSDDFASWVPLLFAELPEAGGGQEPPPPLPVTGTSDLVASSSSEDRSAAPETRSATIR